MDTNPRPASLMSEPSTCKFPIIVSLICLVLGAGCTAEDLRNTDFFDPITISDPNEKANRAALEKQLAFSKTTGLDMSNWYTKNVEGYPTDRMRDFFSNLQEPRNFVTSLLQLKIEKALRSLMRFSINSIFGFFGLVDLMGEAGLEPADEDFGQVFATWGVQQGDFLVLPTGGVSTSRDFLGSLFDLTLDPGIVLGPTLHPAFSALLIRHPLTTVDSYLRNVPLLNGLSDTSLDPYVTIKNAYLSHRRQQILEVDEYDFYSLPE